MESLTNRIKPLLSGAVSIDGIDNHTKQALEIYCHFRGLEIAESLDPDKIKAEIAKVPEPVRELVRQSAIKAYKRLRI